MSTTEKKTSTARTKAAWGAAKRHEITLPSGFVIDIEVPNLPNLIKAGQIPNNLIDAAIGAVESDKVTREMIEQQSEFYDLLVSISVKDPVVEPTDVAELPFEDVEMIVAIATRELDTDALGHQLGGLHKSADWRVFRNLDHRYEDVEGS